MPSFKNIDIQRDSNVAWTIALGSKIVWDISNKDEYLKVSENYIGQKFLERYYSQSVYSSVFFVYKENGQEVSTYLTPAQFESWECNTLEPGYYADGDRQYVGYYQITRNSTFGQHDMKITYKSPRSGRILEVTYPIYYLMEYRLNMDSTEFDWYPFRYLFAETSVSRCVCPAGTLEYRCNARNGNLITEYKHQDFTIQYANYIFPKPDNARYQFGENQRVEMQYLSDAGKLWTQILYVNVRPYTDARNQDCGTYKNVTTYHKNVSSLDFEIKVESGAFEETIGSGINSIKSHDLNEDSLHLDENGDLLPFQYSNSQNISSDEAGFKVHFFTYRGFPLLNPTFKLVDGAFGQYSNVQKVRCLESADFFTSYYDFFDYLQNCTNNGNRTVKYSYDATVVVDPIQIFGNKPKIAGNFSSMESNITSQYKESSSLGYIYWGDGTFDIYCFSDYLSSSGLDLIKPTSKKTSIPCTYADGSIRQVATYPIYRDSVNSTLRCGNTIESERIVAKYESETMIKRHHTYTVTGLSQTYTISITCSASFSDDDSYGSILKLDCTGRNGGFMSYINDLSRGESKWCSPTLGYASQSEILSMVDKSYYYYHNTEGGENHEIYGVEQVNGAQLTADGGPLANCIEVDRGDYYRPFREVFMTYPQGGLSGEPVSGFTPLSIVKNITFGNSLTYRKAYTSTNYMMVTYLDLLYSNISMFMHDVTIDIKSIYNVNISHTTSLSNVVFNYSYANLENKISFGGGSSYVSNKLYFNPFNRNWSAVEKNFYNKGVSDKPHLLLEGNLPHHPTRLQNLGICANATKETTSSGKEYLRVSKIPQYRENGIAIVCSDEVVTLSDLYPDQYPLEIY